ncbi:DUF4097 family beta strand repeat-containing protein [Streptomyces sp. B6B3]|uniref:DUF4097 family beta strand repeat-containing protein n=1 Tax=Streptomyces sp. B6B3 TaxID=3153570 RepID=UPI00325D7A1C
MSGKSEWSVTEAQTLTFDRDPVRNLHVRIVNGTVNVVGTDEPNTRVEITEVEGPPLVVTHEAGHLVVAYEDLPWQGFLKWLNRKGWRRRAVVSVCVPAAARLTVGVVGASAVVSGMEGRADVRGVSGHTTLVGLSGRVHAETVSGDIEAQSLGGELRFNSVSGNLTVIDSVVQELRADAVSGDMVVDLAPCEKPTDLRLNTVSGEVAIRLPDPIDAEVDATTASGGISSAFAELAQHGDWGAKRLAGTLGDGAGSVHCSTVSGSIALLRRPAPPDEPSDTAGPGNHPRQAAALRKDV